MKKAKAIVDKAVGWACVLVMGLMTVLVTYQVITRYFFNSPSATSEVLTRYLFVWLVMLCAAYVFGLREHMNIPFVKDRLPQTLRFACEVLIEIIVAAFGLFVMAYGGILGAQGQMKQLDSALQIPMGAIYAVIPIAGVLMLFYFVCNLSAILGSRGAPPVGGGDGDQSTSGGI